MNLITSAIDADEYVYRHGKWDLSGGIVKLQIGFIREGSRAGLTLAV